MGNYCFQDAIVPSLVEDKQPMRKSFEANSLLIPNNYVLSELKSLPPISKNILNRMQELGPFTENNGKKQCRIYQMKTNLVYQGFLINNLFNGPGKLLLNDGSVIQSQFDMGLPNNKTRIFKPNGDYFSGTICHLDNKKHGVVFENDIKYEGDLFKEKPHGLGKETTKLYTFNGNYENGKKVYGKLKWNQINPKHVQEYQGPFTNNLFHGFGTLTNHEGKYSGNFENGLKSGKGQLIDLSGKKYQGYFLKNKPHGEGKLYNENGLLIMQGRWVNGMPLIIQNTEQIK